MFVFLSLVSSFVGQDLSTIYQAKAEKTRASFEFYQKFNTEFSGRYINGVLLSASTELDNPQKPQTLKIKWGLQYKGPRPPLIIIEPSIKSAPGQTSIEIYTKDNDGKLYQIWVQRASPAGPYVSEKEWFISIEKNKLETGLIEIPLITLRDSLLKDYSKEFSDINILEAYVTISHLPFDRGETHDFDAWTGKLYSPLEKIRIPIK